MGFTLIQSHINIDFLILKIWMRTELLFCSMQVSTTNLFMPEPEDAVAHGDKNLDVNDFFTRTS